MELLNVYLLVKEFYAIEAIVAMLSVSSSFEPMRHSHSRWYRDFIDFRDEYIIKFASAIYDYTVSVVAAELRHSRNCASHYLKDYYTGGVPRDAVFKECLAYDAHDILTAGIRMFDTGRVGWRRAYGGDKWKQIAKSGLIKGRVSDCVFIDHCVDLSHNSSIYFDKCAGIFKVMKDASLYKSFLDLKNSCEPQALIGEKQGCRFNRLLMRANNLNIIEERAKGGLFFLAYDEAESLLFDYHPVKWGNKRLDFSEGNIIFQENFRAHPRRCERAREYPQAA